MSQTERIDLPFAEFFKKATGFAPYEYQERLSEGGVPDMLKIPTGAGKTEAAVLAIWLWRRLSRDEGTRAGTPRRLIYCLPMRTLVEQTRARIDEWLENLNLAESVMVVTMMGGEAADRKGGEYRLHPEEDMIIVGTQDMLLSRALNRGYGVSMFAYPQEFGMTNNDCMWILDEIQLMHNGLATSVQLDAFREKMGTYGPRKTVWMSATAELEWLRTVDAKEREFAVFELGEGDFAGVLGKRSGASKTLRVMDMKKSGNNYERKDAKKILAEHESGTMTLIIVNTVKRAQSLYGELSKIAKDPTEIMLVHSRFRGQDKARFKDRLAFMSGKGGARADVIVVATQVVEAGLDISAKTLVTEAAPWPSLVQRFGRCNRYGEFPDSKIHFITLKPAAGSPRYPPYDDADMDGVMDAVKDGQSAAPKSLALRQMPAVRHEHVVRRPHMLGLFDTTADIAGSHTDVSRYVRSIENSKDVHVFWRKWDESKEPPEFKAEAAEICSVPVWDITGAKNKLKTHVYDHLLGRWNRIGHQDVRPGQTVLLHCNQGRYTDEAGWDLKSSKRVDEAEHGGLAGDSLEKDNWSDAPMTLNDHTAHVHNEMALILQHLPHLDGDVKGILLESAVLHDVGKAHEEFQAKIDKPDGWTSEICGKGKPKAAKRKFIRHEAASALAVLQWYGDTDIRRNSMAYLCATHHGKVGMAMRPVYQNHKRGAPDGSAAGLDGRILGISTEKDDEMEVFLSKDSATANSREDRIIREYGKTVKINAGAARIGTASDGRRSWLQITLELLEEYGPFRLAYMEAVMRAADQRASRKGAES